MVRYHGSIDPDGLQWEEVLRRSQGRSGVTLWRQWFDDPFDAEMCDEITAAGFDGEIVRRVWPVAYAVLRPPVPE
jgi:hypothetical protein